MLATTCSRGLVALFVSALACGHDTPAEVPEDSRPSKVGPPLPDGIKWGQAIPIPHEHRSAREWIEGIAVSGEFMGVTVTVVHRGYCDDRLCAFRGFSVTDPNNVSPETFIERMTDRLGPPKDSSRFFDDGESGTRYLYWEVQNGGVMAWVDPAGGLSAFEAWWAPAGGIEVFSSGMIDDCTHEWVRLSTDGGLLASRCTSDNADTPSARWLRDRATHE